MAIVVMKRASDVIPAIVRGSCAHAHRPLHWLEMLANYLMLLLSLSWFFVALFVSCFFLGVCMDQKKKVRVLRSEARLWLKWRKNLKNKNYYSTIKARLSDDKQSLKVLCLWSCSWSRDRWYPIGNDARSD